MPNGQALTMPVSKVSTIPALTRRRRDGTLYTRRVDVEKSLAKLIGLPRGELLAALRIRDAGSEHYIRSECIIHLIRAARHDNDQAYFGALYRELMRRLASALPRGDGEGVNPTENVHAATARDHVRDHLNQKIAEDRAEPGSDLDYFEVMFAGAVFALRKTALRNAGRHAARTTPIEADEDTNEPSVAVERAVGSLDIKAELYSDDPVYRSRVAAAIQSLPDKQRRVIEMIIQGMPLDSTEKGVLSIRSVLGVAEKTVRNRRDAAIRTLRTKLGLDTDNG
jgi:hypothetical protein